MTSRCWKSTQFPRIPRFLISLAVLAVLLLRGGSSARAQSQSLPLPTPLTTITGVPTPAADAFLTSLRYGPDGLLYAWDGAAVWKQSGINSNGFNQIGTISTAGADAGPINFSQSGSTILVSNGFGGFAGGSSNGLLFAIPATGGNATTPLGTVLNNFDLIPVPVSSGLANSSTKFYVDSSDGGSGSVVSIFDDRSGGSNVPIITGIPGASTSLAFNTQNHRLYVGVGFGADQGEIKSFALSVLDAAYNGTPLDYNSQGLLFNGPDANNSGSGMFFDARGDLFTAGANGLEVLSPSGQSWLYSTGANNFAETFYNPTNDELALFTAGDGIDPNPFPNPMIFNASQFAVVPEPATGALALVGGGLLLAYARYRKRLKRRRGNTI